jgi:hypothetical protein
MLSYFELSVRRTVQLHRFLLFEYIGKLVNRRHEGIVMSRIKAVTLGGRPRHVTNHKAIWTLNVMHIEPFLKDY